MWDSIQEVVSSRFLTPIIPDLTDKLIAVPRKERLTVKGVKNQQGQNPPIFACLTNILILLLCFNMK